MIGSLLYASVRLHYNTSATINNVITECSLNLFKFFCSLLYPTRSVQSNDCFQSTWIGSSLLLTPTSYPVSFSFVYLGIFLEVDFVSHCVNCMLH